MRLSRIEMKGFKSFADETHILFTDDIIGIVGPNGSGKSNIVDAVRWVLGEQSSRELRLESMGDVIFNGSRAKKAGKVARVSLTFENTKNLLPTEYTEITLTRKLYRSGESEYQINDVKCRLKDIKALFMDSGIGSNSYAIIALGMVDDILADKENARRMMFEEAAGISKYKERKKETLNKLRHTEEDLDRIEDLVFEIEKNLKSFERQARRTKRFYEIKNEYKELSTALASIQLHHHRKEKKETAAKLEKEMDRIRQLETSITQKEAEIETVKKANTDQEIALSQSQKGINQLAAKIRNTEENLRIDKQQLDFRSKERSEHDNRITTLQGEEKELAEKRKRYDEKAAQEEATHRKMKNEWEKASEELNALKEKYENSKASFDSQYADIRELEKITAHLEKSIAISESRQETYVHDQQRLEGSIKEIKRALEGRQGEVEKLVNEEKKWVAKIDQLEEEIFQKQSEKENLENKEESIVKVLQRLNRQLDAKTNERKLLIEFMRKMEGFPESIKFLSRNKSWKGRGIILSDLLSAEPPYRGLLESFLDQYLNYFVVQSVDDAVEAIRLLSESDKGRGQFFILDELDGSVKDTPDADDGEERALDLVSYDPKYDPLFRSLLKNVYFAESGTEDQWSGNPEKVILGKDGRIQRAKGMMTGGVVNLFEGSKLGRQQQIDQLENEIEEIQQKIQNCEEELDQLNDRISELDTTKIEENLRSWTNEVNGVRSRQMKITTTMEIEEKSLEKEKNNLRELITAIEMDAKEWGMQKEKWKKLQTELNEKQKQLADKDTLYRSLSDQYNALRQEYNQFHIKVVQQENLLETVHREQEVISEKENSLKKELSHSVRKVEESEEAIEKLQLSIKQYEKSLLKDMETRKSKEALLNDAERDYYKARSAVGELEAEVKSLNQQYRNSQSLVNGWKDTMNSIKFAISRIIERMQIEFEIGDQDIPDEVDSTMLEKRDDLEQKSEKLKNRIQNYGEINPLAVEAFDEIKERYDNIVQQRDDVIDARKQLIETIDEIETTATQKFMDAFNQVRENFIEVFRRLFTEDDTCDLILLDAENPLESKIEIVAKPKGKKPKSISQLSGGEKTLTATALLFALYLLKPAPFCIFDEVDAPLDDANIYKFNRIIKEFSKESQFVIVTHNKLTMEAVDVIYGVFMEDTGVSKVAAVDFRHLEEISELATTG
ncbi:chromosome segregation protein SMC [Membranihabitans marinus]|nr:chromosome segregation protein SMC [Membranihabitans marinus]